MLEFENLSVMIFDVFMDRLVLLFTEGLTKPLKELLKSHNPYTLKDSMNLTRDLQNVFPKTRFPPKPRILFPYSNMGGKHGKGTLFSRRKRNFQANKNSTQINCALPIIKFGFWDISVQKGRHTTLKFSLKMRKRERRKNHNL